MWARAIGATWLRICWKM